jgi:hypothetical protein
MEEQLEKRNSDVENCVPLDGPKKIVMFLLSCGATLLGRPGVTPVKLVVDGQVNNLGN